MRTGTVKVAGLTLRSFQLGQDRVIRAVLPEMSFGTRTEPMK